MEDSDRPEQDELNKIEEWLYFLEDFMLGCDPSWHEHKGIVKQEDD